MELNPGEYKKNDRFGKAIWYNQDRKEIEKRSKKIMRRTYDDYDFERLYSDVNENYFGYSLSIQTVESCYDTYTGSSDDYYYDWN